MSYVNFILTAVAGSPNFLQLALAVLFSVGLWQIFKKCGIKKWWSFVPVVRHYQLAKCANSKEDAIVWIGAQLITEVAGTFSIGMMMLVEIVTNVIVYTSFVIFIIFFCIYIVYAIKIYGALCQVFDKKKWWIPLWIILPPVTALIWGFAKGFDPIYLANGDMAPAVSGIKAQRLEQGLTINIKSKTIHDSFRTVTLLKDIHLNIRPGRMVLLLGGSGAGKTTFINAINGYERADAEILLNGLDVYRKYNQVKYDIGYVPQQELIRYQDTVYNVINSAAKLRLPSDISSEERKKRVDDIIDMLGLTDVKDQKVGKQSGGQKKRISIASELISDPFVYMLDEPDSGLDGILARFLMQQLNKIAHQGKIVIVITHNPDHVLEFFDDIIVLAKDSNHTGRLVFYGAVSEAKRFFESNTMEGIIKSINLKEEGGDGRADELIEKFRRMNDGTER